MKIEAITNFDDFLKLEQDWNSVLESSGSDHVCLTFEWFKAWWQSFGENKQLFVLRIKDGNEVIGMAPLMIERSSYRGIPVREMKFIENENSPKSDFIISKSPEKALDAIFEVFIEHKNIWDLIRLNNIPRESPNFEILQKSAKNHDLLFGVKEGYFSPFVKIDKSWNVYYEGLSKKFQKYLRYKTNKASRKGGFEIKKIENLSNNREILQKISEISKNSWKGKIKRDIACTPTNQLFFERLTRIAESKGWLNIWLLEINGQTVAYEYKLHYKNSVCGMRSDFDEKYDDISPGAVLRLGVLKNAFEDNLKEFDMGAGEQLYKKNWTDDTREHARVLVYKKDLLGYILYFIEFRVIVFLKKLNVTLYF